MLYSIPQVSVHGLLFFGLLVSHFCMFSLLICTCILLICVSPELASSVAVDGALLFHTIAEVSRNDYFVACCFLTFARSFYSFVCVCVC